MARGAIARYVATRALDSPDGLKGFTGSNDEWSYDAPASTSDVFVFKRRATPAPSAKPIAQNQKVKAEILQSSSEIKTIVAHRVASKSAVSATALAD